MNNTTNLLALVAVGFLSLVAPRNALAIPAASCQPQGTPVAPDDFCFGTEMTFTGPQIWGRQDDGNRKNVADSPYEKLLAEWLKAVQTSCQGQCTATKIDNAPVEWNFLMEHHFQQGHGVGHVVLVQYAPNGPGHGWWYVVSTDRGVLELQTRPMTHHWATDLQTIIDRDIFKVANAIGLAPHWHFGAGHIHMDLESAFKNSPVKMWNLIVEIENIGYWPMFLLHRALKNASMLRIAQLTDGSQNVMAKHLSKVEQRLQELLKSGPSVVELARELNKDVYSQPFNTETIKEPEGTVKYHFFRMDESRFVPKLLSNAEADAMHVPHGTKLETATLEVRGLAPERSAEDLITILGLFRKAVAHAPDHDIFHTMAVSKPIKVDPTKKPLDDGQLVYMDLDDASAKSVAHSFHDYLERIGATAKERTCVRQYMSDQIGAVYDTLYKTGQ